MRFNKLFARQEIYTGLENTNAFCHTTTTFVTKMTPGGGTVHPYSKAQLSALCSLEL